MNKTNFLLVFLLLIGGLFATITLYEPANATTLYGSTQTFNWSDNNASCTDSWFDVYSDGGLTLFANITTVECSDNYTLTNLTCGDYVWYVHSMPSTDNSVNRTFTIEAQVNTSIIYPPASPYAIGPGQCWMELEIQTNVSPYGSSPTTGNCSLFYTNGTIKETKTLTTMNRTLNFSDLHSYSYYANCTVDVNGTLATTQTIQYDVTGTTMCSLAEDNDKTGMLIVIGTVGIIIIGLIYPKERLIGSILLFATSLPLIAITQGETIDEIISVLYLVGTILFVLMNIGDRGTWRRFR